MSQYCDRRGLHKTRYESGSDDHSAEMFEVSRVQLQSSHQQDHIERHGDEGARDEGVQLMTNVARIAVREMIISDVDQDMSDVLHMEETRASPGS